MCVLSSPFLHDSLVGFDSAWMYGPRAEWISLPSLTAYMCMTPGPRLKILVHSLARYGRSEAENWAGGGAELCLLVVEKDRSETIRKNRFGGLCLLVTSTANENHLSLPDSTPIQQRQRRSWYPWWPTLEVVGWGCLWPVSLMSDIWSWELANIQYLYIRIAHSLYLLVVREEPVDYQRSRNNDLQVRLKNLCESNCFVTLLM